MASNVGSLGGNVNLSAGGTYSQIASNVVSAKDINITAAQIELLTADEVGHSSQRDDDLKIGVFARVKSPFIDLINNVDAARQSDGRLSSMQNMAAAANAYQAASAIANATGAGGSGALFNAEAGIGFKTANSSADSSSVVSQGSTLQAGGNLNLTSTSGDIHVVQGNLSAGNTVSLDSARDILLEAGKAQLQDKSKSSNAGAEVGVGVQVGAQTGAYVYAEASVGSSKSNADSTTWQNTTLTGQNISLKAEGDTTLRGATATADRIDVKTGGTLTIESLQDVAESMSKNSQVGGRVQVSIGTAWNVDGYASAGKSNGSYQGVGQQSGLFAGAGGYHVDATHVNLVGGAIASTNAANSELTAETLTFSDLQNHMQHNTASAGISGGYSGAMDGWTPQLEGATPNFGPGLPMIEKGGDSSTTRATLTEGNIVIGGKQTTAAELGLNTDAAAAHRAIDALPNAEKLLADQQAMAAAMGTVTATSKQIANDIGGQAMRNLENDYVSKLSDEEKARFKAQSAQDKAWELKTQRGSDFNAAEDQMKNWGIGSANGRALEAVTALLVGGCPAKAGGQLAANALAPYAAQLIGSKFDTDHGSDPNAAVQALSHALLGAVLAELNGGSAGGGALSAAGGELAAGFLKNAFPNADRETISALSQAVGALAAGMAGGSLSSAALGAGIAKNSVENNRLLTSVELARIKELSNGDLSREVELTAAACALVKCSAGFPEGSEEHARWADIEAFGSAPALQDDRDWLKAQVQPNYSLYAAGKGINSDYTLFAYGLSGQYDDWFSRNQGSTRVQGGLQMLTGVAQAAGGFALVPTCETGIGCVASAYLAASGYDNAIAGWRTAIDGKFAATLGGRVFQVGGVSPEVAEMLYALTQVAAAARVPAINPGNAFAEFGPTPPRISNGVILDPRLPDPVAGLGYEPTVLNSFNPNIANSHLNGYVGELKLANTVASLPDQVVVKYGDAIGRNGADVISVDAKTGAVTLWDNKFRSTRAGLRGSPTFAEGSPALESARQEAIIAIERSSLPAATKAKALDQLLDRTFTTHTVGSGSARNSTISKFCNGSICE